MTKRMPKKDHIETRTLQVRLYSTDYSKVEELATKQGLTVSEYVRMKVVPKPSKRFPVRQPK